VTSTCIAVAMGVLAHATPIAATSGDQAAFILSAVELDGERHLQMLDMNGDGALDFVQVGYSGVAVHLMQPSGTYPGEPDATLDWDGSHIGWQLADIDSDGHHELLLLTDARELTVHRLKNESFTDGVVLLENAKAALPRGVHRVPFARDIDSDGLADIVIPAANGYDIYRMRDNDLLDSPIRLA